MASICNMRPVHHLRVCRLLLLVLLTGCQPRVANDANTQNESTVPTVMVTAEPLYQMARNIAAPSLADGQISIERATGDASLSASWRPSSDRIRSMQAAQLLLISGAGYEPWKVRVTLPRSRMIDTASGYYDQLIRIPDAVQHQHGPDGQHSHAGTVWATWLDPQLLVSQAEQVERSLVTLLPEQETSLRLQTQQLQNELERLDARVQELARRTAERKIRVLADGPFYQYLIRRLDWQLTYLHWSATPGTLSDEAVKEFQAATADTTFDVFLMLDVRDAAALKLVETVGLAPVSIDLCEGIRDDSMSLPDRLSGNLDRLSQVIDGLQ